MELSEGFIQGLTWVKPFVIRSDRIFTLSKYIFTPIAGYMGYRQMSIQDETARVDLEQQAKVLTARMNAVRYIGEQAMWMYGCAHNILKEYERATNIDIEFADLCADVKQRAWDKAKACEKYAAEIQERLARVMDRLEGDQ